MQFIALILNVAFYAILHNNEKINKHYLFDNKMQSIL